MSELHLLVVNYPQQETFSPYSAKLFGIFFHQQQMFVNPHRYLNAVPCSTPKKETSKLNQLLPKHHCSTPCVCVCVFWN